LALRLDVIRNEGSKNRRTFLKGACFAGAAALLASCPVFIERHLVQRNHYRVPVPLLPKSFNGFRVVHLTDLHMGFLVSRAFIEKVISVCFIVAWDMGSARGFGSPPRVPRTGSW
jgi:hypothetical protein